MSTARTRRPAGAPSRRNRPFLTLTAALTLATLPVVGALPATAAPTDATLPAASAAPGSSDGTVPTAEDVDDPAVVAPAPGTVGIQGAAAAGQTVSVDPLAEAWSPAGTTFSYAWTLGGGTDVVGTAASLTLEQDACGSDLAVAITGTAPGATPATLVVEATAPVAACTGSVAVSGAPRVGETLLAVGAGWSPGAPPTFEWLRDGDVVGAGSTYSVTASDLGSTLAARATSTVDGLDPVSATSAPTAPVTMGTLVSSVPTLSGAVRVGSVVTASPGSWTDATTFSYQWRVDGRAVAGATEATFTPSPAHRGRRLDVLVRGAKDGFPPAHRASVAATVGWGVLTTEPTSISGSARVGRTVTAVHAAWTPDASYTYQWRADGTVVAGATSASFTIPATLRGKQLAVRVVGTRPGYATRSATSAPSTVTASFAAAPRPTISGVTRVYSTLTAVTGAWSPAPTLVFQWARDGAPIPGATKRSYRLTPADYGTTLTVSVTGRRSTYATTTRTSAPSGKVISPAASTDRDGLLVVGRDIAPGTYVSTFTAICTWSRLDANLDVIARVRADGRQIVTIKPSDAYFLTNTCGKWKRYAAIGTEQTSTTAYGTWAVGTAPGELRPGYYTTSSRTCRTSVLSDFSGDEASYVERIEVAKLATVRLDPAAGHRGLRTHGCVWTWAGPLD